MGLTLGTCETWGSTCDGHRPVSRHALANIQKQLLAGGKAHLVGDRELYNTAAELTKIMGHKNPDRFFCDPDARDPQTGQLLHPPPAPPAPPPDPKLLVVQAKAQSDQAIAAHQARRQDGGVRRTS